MPSAREYADAVSEARGLVSVAARRLGVDRSAVYQACKRHPTVQQALDDARERTTDLAEGKLYEQITEGNLSAIIFYLKTQGKDRGYVERQERHHSGAVRDLTDEELARIAAGDDD